MNKSGFAKTVFAAGMIRILRHFAVCAAAVLLLSACQSGLDSSTTGSGQTYWQEMRTRLAAVQVLNLKGRMAFSSAVAGGKKLSSGFSYRCDPDTYALSLLTPFGTELGELKVTRDGAMLTSHGISLTSADAGDLLHTVYGLDVPAEKMKEIFLGLPPGDVTYDSDGKVRSAVYGSYTIEYGEFREYSGLALPVTFTVEGRSITVKIRVGDVLDIK